MSGNAGWLLASVPARAACLCPVPPGGVPGCPSSLWPAILLPQSWSSAWPDGLQTAGRGLQCPTLRCERTVPAPPLASQGSPGPRRDPTQLRASSKQLCMARSQMCLCPVPVPLGTRLSGSGSFKLLILFSCMLLTPWFKFCFSDNDLIFWVLPHEPLLENPGISSTSEASAPSTSCSCPELRS